MKIAIAQTKSIKGAIVSNIKNHVFFIKKAIDLHADIIVFPELSITNYEPVLANDLAMDLTDERLTIFKDLACKHKISIALGIPLKQQQGVTISLLIFKPNKEIVPYAKQLLHKDELPYFVAGSKQVYNSINDEKMGFAICYESMFESHFLNTY